jgi:signal transduction histidine kinase
MEQAEAAEHERRQNETGVAEFHEAQIEALRERIDQLERERDAAEGFAALAAHELVAPLVFTEACVARAEDCLDATASHDLLEALAVLARGASRTRRLVELLLHEASANGRPLDRHDVDLMALTRDCIGLLAPEIEARRAHIVYDALPVVKGEPELLGGLITNLLMNAIKFNPREGGEVRVAGERHAGGWTVHVESQGPPIPAYDRERIFEPFYRGRGERRARGAGLGLAICVRIAEGHGGTIGLAEPSDAYSTRFYFTLPD